MSQQYFDYLNDHITNVQRAAHWMVDHRIVSGFPAVNDFLFSVPRHDESKYSREEFEAYDDYFYGKEGKDEDDIAVIDEAFDYAWLHHIHHNPHHWQYWLLQEDDGNLKALAMNQKDIYEMIADWWSFSWKNGNLYEIFDWYGKRKDRIILHNKTRMEVENILTKIRLALDEEKAEKEALENGGNHDAGSGAE